jgi:hypothetical protein
MPKLKQGKVNRGCLLDIRLMAYPVPAVANKSLHFSAFLLFLFLKFGKIGIEGREFHQPSYEI